MKYAGYIDAKKLKWKKFREMEDKQIPNWIDYNQVLCEPRRPKVKQDASGTLGQAFDLWRVSADICLV